MTTSPLSKDFPIILRDSPGGISYPPGWTKIIRALCSQLEQIAAEQPPEHRLRIAQIKLKFGQLRVYVDNAPRTALHIIASTERASATICEKCGCHGDSRPTKGGYVYTLCDQCYESR